MLQVYRMTVCAGPLHAAVIKVIIMFTFRMTVGYEIDYKI